MKLQVKLWQVLFGRDNSCPAYSEAMVLLPCRTLIDFISNLAFYKFILWCLHLLNPQTLLEPALPSHCGSLIT